MAHPESVILPSVIILRARSLFLAVQFDFGLRGEKRVTKRSASMDLKPMDSVQPKHIASSTASTKLIDGFFVAYLY